MKTALIATTVGMLALCASSSVKAASTNCSDMSTIVTAADVDLCFHDIPGLEKWKEYWQIDTEENPWFQNLNGKFPEPVVVMGTSFWNRSAIVRVTSLNRLGYTEFDTNIMYSVEKNGQRMNFRPSKIGQNYKNKWLFAEDCLKALELDLADREIKLAAEQAANQNARRDKEALARLELPELQELTVRQPKRLENERNSIDFQRQEIPRFRGLKGALDRVTEKLREYALLSGAVGAPGPIFTSLLEDGVKF